MQASFFLPRRKDLNRGTRDDYGLHVSAKHPCINYFINGLYRIKVIVISRLVYRKGVDLLVGIIPIICRRHTNVDFIVGGDGSRKIYLDEMIEREKLQDRVSTLGAIPHKDVSSILVQGHIFLNCSLTESFCIAILEAASCGLYVVSTNVGGIPEVLPHESMMRLSEPSVSSMTKSLSEVIETKIYTDQQGYITTNFDSFQLHENIRTMYSWDYVAIKTMVVYKEIINLPPLTFWQRSERYRSVGDFGGCIACILHFLLFVVVKVMEWNQPRHLIDVVPSLLDTCDLKETHIQNGDVN
jgi:phosphatidylinositol glycan class A protein